MHQSDRSPLFVTNSSTTAPDWINSTFGQPAALPEGRLTPRRARLLELDNHFHCSLIGTCLGTGELRKLVPRFTDIDRKASDLQIHHMAVRLSSESPAGSKALQKLLDTRYAPEIKRFNRYKSADELQAAWSECLKAGDVPGAYWALMTHPAATEYLRQLAFGEVHMLSHLVGAANRADIHRLQALEDEKIRLQDKVERQQGRLQALAMEREALQRQAMARTVAPADERIVALEEQIHALHGALHARDQTIAHHHAHTHRLESALNDAEARIATLTASLQEWKTRADDMRVELNALDRHLSAPLDHPATTPADTPGLNGKRIVYVGGRPHSTQTISRYVKSSGGELIIHDGGLEDRRSLLPNALAGADLVVFPVDCVAHNAVTLLKRSCDRHEIPYRALRSASLASFMAALSVFDASHACPGGGAGAAHFCLHHG